MLAMLQPFVDGAIANTFPSKARRGAVLTG